MWNYLKGLFSNGSIITKLLTGIVAFLVAFVLILGALSGGEEAIGGLAFLAYVIWHRFKTPLTSIFKEVSTVPYWGDKFGRQKCIRLLAEDKFRPYVTSYGKKVRGLKVSDSGRWFAIMGRFYPLYLVKDYNRALGELFMINGDSIKDQPWQNDREIVDALDDLLDSNRIFEKDKSIRRSAIAADSSTAFKRVWKKSYAELANADWDQIRYEWEKELAEIESRTFSRKDMTKHNLGLENVFVARESVFNRVLMDQELLTIAYAIKDGKIKDTADWWDLSKYKDDLCVCNGTQLLRRIDYPHNKSGEAFLFECLRDIQKPYFEDAAYALSKFPREQLIEEIEKHVKAAHEEGDVLFGAGLIYLSKLIDYKISLAQEQEVTSFSQGGFQYQAK